MARRKAPASIFGRSLSPRPSRAQSSNAFYPAPLDSQNSNCKKYRLWEQPYHHPAQMLPAPKREPPGSKKRAVPQARKLTTKFSWHLAGNNPSEAVRRERMMQSRRRPQAQQVMTLSRGASAGCVRAGVVVAEHTRRECPQALLTVNSPAFVLAWLVKKFGDTRHTEKLEADSRVLTTRSRPVSFLRHLPLATRHLPVRQAGSPLPFSNRNSPRLEFRVTHRKQTVVTISNRRKTAFSALTPQAPFPIIARFIAHKETRV